MPFSNKDYFLLKCSGLWFSFKVYAQIFLTAMPIKKNRMFKNKYRLKVILTKTFVKKITEIDKKIIMFAGDLKKKPNNHTFVCQYYPKETQTTSH